MTPFQKTAATALLLILGSGCDRFNDGLTGTPPAGATALTSFSGTYDLPTFGCYGHVYPGHGPGPRGQPAIGQRRRPDQRI